MDYLTAAEFDALGTDREKTMEETDELPVLEVLCPNCRGAGGWKCDEGWHSCGRCNGAGHVPTEFGERVLALMRHNFKPMLDDARDE